MPHTQQQMQKVLALAENREGPISSPASTCDIRLETREHKNCSTSFQEKQQCIIEPEQLNPVEFSTIPGTLRFQMYQKYCRFM